MPPSLPRGGFGIPQGFISSSEGFPIRGNSDDRRQWRKQGVAVGAAASACPSYSSVLALSVHLCSTALPRDEPPVAETGVAAGKRSLSSGKRMLGRIACDDGEGKPPYNSLHASRTACLFSRSFLMSRRPSIANCAAGMGSPKMTRTLQNSFIFPSGVS